MAEDNPLVGLLQRSGRSLAVAESLTGGQLSSRLAKLPGASQWYRGAVVAYASEVKHEVLGVRPGPVVSREAALDMAHGAAKLLDASVTIAVTGVGGPDPQDGQPPGTVWVAVWTDEGEEAVRLDLGGDPEEIVEGTCRHCFDVLLEHLARRQLDD